MWKIAHPPEDSREISTSLPRKNAALETYVRGCQFQLMIAHAGILQLQEIRRLEGHVHG